MKLTLGPFKGEIPRTDKGYLPAGFAQLARNSKLWSGGLRSFRQARAAAILSKVGVKHSLYRWGAVPGGDRDGLISGILVGTPAVILSDQHGLQPGDRVYLNGTLTPLDDAVYSVGITNSSTFTLDGVTASVGSSTGYWVKQNGYFFHWLEDVDATPGTIPGDQLDRLYYTGSGAPKMTYAGIATQGGGTDYPTNSYLLGVPAPIAPPDISVDLGACDPADQITSAYVVTFVTELDEEGAPSPPTGVVTFCPGSVRHLTNIPQPPAGNYNITRKRLYRIPFGVATYQFVDEIPAAQDTYDDSSLDTDLGEDIPSADPRWTPPPADMHSIGFMANGIGYGASGVDVCITVTFTPYAWPVEYRLTCKYPIVTTKSFDTNIVAVTQGVPYLITGSDPAGLSMTEFTDFRQSCISKRGTVGLDGYGVVYPSPNGLVAVTLSGPQLITKTYFTPDEWKAFNPDSIVAFAHDGRYYAFYDTGVQRGGFIFDPTEGGAGLIHIDQACTGGFQDLLEDTLYLIVGDRVVEWEGATALQPYQWRSPLLRTPAPTNFAYVQVFADSYENLYVRLIGDGVSREYHQITSNDPQLLSDDYTCQEWEVEVTGTDNLRGLAVAEMIEDLRGQ